MSVIKIKNIILLSLLLSLITIVNSFFFLQKSQHPLLDNNVFTVSKTVVDCSKKGDVLRINYIKLIPDPPVKGRRNVVEAAGFLKETIMNGSYIDVVVRFGLVKFYDERLDLCENSVHIGKYCPIKKGYHKLYHVFELPDNILPGVYNADIIAYTSDNREISCIMATVEFGL